MKKYCITATVLLVSLFTGYSAYAEVYINHTNTDVAATSLDITGGGSVTRMGATASYWTNNYGQPNNPGAFCYTTDWNGPNRVRCVVTTYAYTSTGVITITGEKNAKILANPPAGFTTGNCQYMPVVYMSSNKVESSQQNITSVSTEQSLVRSVERDIAVGSRLTTINKPCSQVTVSDLPSINSFSVNFYAMELSNPSECHKYIGGAPKVPCSGASWGFTYVLKSGSAYRILNKYVDVPWVPNPPEPVVCTTSGNFTLDHGSIGKNMVNNNTQSSKLSLVCNKPATANLTIITQGGANLDLGGGISSSLKLDKNLVSLAGKGQSSEVTVSSTLSGQNVTAGVHSGTAVLLIDFK